MNEAEIETPADAAEFLASEVLNEYHDIPACRPAGRDVLFVSLNGRWFRFLGTEVTDPAVYQQLEDAR